MPENESRSLTEDPIVMALASVFEEVLHRGLQVTPLNGGWLVRVAAEPQGSDLSAAQARRTW